MAKCADIVIVGGAVTGSVLALALSHFSQHKMHIAIVEKSLPNYAEQGGFDARSIALAWGSLQKFRQIEPLAGGNLAQLIEQIASPIQQIHVSDKGHFGKTTLSAQELNLEKLGVVVELEKLGQKLAQQLEQQPNISLYCPDTVVQVERTAETAILTLQSGEQLQTPLIVAADGIRSWIAQTCGVETVSVRDYQQSAIVANVEVSAEHQGQAFERFTSEGPLALLPLKEKQMSLVWCVADPVSKMALNEQDFLQQLQQQFGWQLGKFVRLSKRYVYPLTSQKAQSHTHHRLAVVGNAAQFLHPVAGQGFNLGLRDLFELSQIVCHAFNQQQDWGSYAVLNQYQQRREADQNKMIQQTSGLISLFCCEFLPYQLARNLGLFAVSHSRFAREAVANRALGW